MKYVFGVFVVEQTLAYKPDVPAWLDTGVFRVPDNRTFSERRTYAPHNCSYPSDTTTLDDLHEVAHNRAKAGESDYFTLTNIDDEIFRCDECDPGFEGSYAWFCSEEDSSRNVTFMRAAYGGSKPGQACWVPGSATLAGSVGYYTHQHQIGVEHGAIVEAECYNRTSEYTTTVHPGINCYYPSKSSYKRIETGCSPQQPADSCVLKKGWERICECDENCNSKHSTQPDDCCTLTKTIEKLEVYYSWFECTIGDNGPPCGSSNTLV